MTSRTFVTILALLVVGGCAQLKAVFTRTAPSPATVHRPAQPERREPPPRLSPQVSSDQEERLMEEANKKIRGAEENLLSIDPQKLAADQQDTYQTIHSFLIQARAALSRKDFPRALNLAQKAQILSDELSRVIR